MKGHKRLNLYIPEEDVKLVEEARKLLREEGKSISQFFLESVRDYLKRHKGKNRESLRKELLSLKETEEKVLNRIANLISSIEDIEEKLKLKVIPFEDLKKDRNRLNLDSRNLPDAVIYSDKLSKIVAFVEVKFRYLPQILGIVIHRYYPILKKLGIPYLIIVIANKNGDIERVTIFDVLSFREFSISRKAYLTLPKELGTFEEDLKSAIKTFFSPASILIKLKNFAELEEK